MMTKTCLAINGWDENFENAETRKKKDSGSFHWLRFPVNLSGSGYCEIMIEDDGPQVYGAFVAMLQIAAKCSPRGVLIRSNGKPHDAKSISVVSRIPLSVIEIAIERLSEIGWLTTVPVAVGIEFPLDQESDSHSTRNEIPAREDKRREEKRREEIKHTNARDACASTSAGGRASATEPENAVDRTSPGQKPTDPSKFAQNGTATRRKGAPSTSESRDTERRTETILADSGGYGGGAWFPGVWERHRERLEAVTTKAGVVKRLALFPARAIRDSIVEYVEGARADPDQVMTEIVEAFERIHRSHVEAGHWGRKLDWWISPKNLTALLEGAFEAERTDIDERRKQAANGVRPRYESPADRAARERKAKLDREYPEDVDSLSTIPGFENYREA